MPRLRDGDLRLLVRLLGAHGDGEQWPRSRKRTAERLAGLGLVVADGLHVDLTDAGVAALRRLATPIDSWRTAPDLGPAVRRHDRGCETCRDAVAVRAAETRTALTDRFGEMVACDEWTSELQLDLERVTFEVRPLHAEVKSWFFGLLSPGSAWLDQRGQVQTTPTIPRLPSFPSDAPAAAKQAAVEDAAWWMVVVQLARRPKLRALAQLAASQPGNVEIAHGSVSLAPETLASVVEAACDGGDWLAEALDAAAAASPFWRPAQRALARRRASRLRRGALAGVAVPDGSLPIVHLAAAVAEQALALGRELDAFADAVELQMRGDATTALGFRGELLRAEPLGEFEPDPVRVVEVLEGNALFEGLLDQVVGTCDECLAPVGHAHAASCARGPGPFWGRYASAVGTAANECLQCWRPAPPAPLEEAGLLLRRAAELLAEAGRPGASADAVRLALEAGTEVSDGLLAGCIAGGALHG
jgi:hypothetical protein